MTPAPSSPARGARLDRTAVIPIILSSAVVIAVAIPGFLTWGLPKQAQVQINLKALIAGERSLFLKSGRYSEVVEDIGFVPVAGNRYVYLLSAAPTLAHVVAFDPSPAPEHTGIDADERSSARVTVEALERATPPDVWQDLGVHGTCPEACAMTAVAGSNLDADATIDVWSISTRDRVIDGVTVPAGTPFNHVDDVRN